MADPYNKNHSTVGGAPEGFDARLLAEALAKTNAPVVHIARDDARRLISEDPTLESPRGKAARTLLWLMRQDQAIKMISVG